jgi:hypothetical protein
VKTGSLRIAIELLLWCLELALLYMLLPGSSPLQLCPSHPPYFTLFWFSTCDNELVGLLSIGNEYVLLMLRNIKGTRYSCYIFTV